MFAKRSILFCSKRNMFFFILFLLLFNFSLQAEIDNAATLGIFKLEIKDIPEQTGVVVNNTIFNFIKELKKYKIYDMRLKTLNDEEKKQFNFVFTGSMYGFENEIKLDLVLENISTGMKRVISKTYPNSNLILLDSRLLVSDLFNMSLSLSNKDSFPSETDEDSDDAVEITNMDVLSGSWLGEEGIERIEIMRGGRAIAVLSSGISIFLNLKLENGYLFVTQLGVPQQRQFLDLPDVIAKQAVQLGKTPSWKFLISKNSKTLLGEKTDLEIIYSGESITSNKEVTKKIQWVKR